MMKITFIQTGGTIDKGYPPTATNHGYNFEILEPASINILKNAHVSFETEHISVFKKDSTDITDADRQTIFNAVFNIANENIIITHGTDTIYQTDQKLSTGDVQNKKIVLTGAMLPAEFTRSEAMFNLGMAIGAIQVLRAPGIYIALYGVTVPWDQFPKVEKTK